MRNGWRGGAAPGIGGLVKIDLSGRSALITGSTRGIGRAIAETLALCGAKVAIVGRDKARAAEVAAQIPGSSAKGFACDVGQVDSVTQLVSDVERELGSVDILVNNAGITR